MDYAKIYADFIENRRQRGAPTGYCESHHVKPRAFGGDDSEANLIDLTARDHYFAHCCLAKIHGGEMWGALCLMARTQKTEHGATPFSAGRMFAIAREQAAAVRSADMRQRWGDGSFKRNRIYGPTSEKQKEAAAGWQRGRKRDPAEAAKAVATKQTKAPRFDFVEVATGRQFSGTALEFRRDSKLAQSHISRLTTGQVNVAAGWALKGNENKPTGNRDRTVRIFKHRDGRVFEGTAYDFNKTHIQDSGMLSNCIHGKNGVKTARGWSYVGTKET